MYIVFIHSTCPFMYIPSVVAPGITLLDSVEAMLLLTIPLAGIIDEVVVDEVVVDEVVVDVCISDHL